MSEPERHALLADSMENVLVILAGKYGRHPQIYKGEWGFSQGSGYLPTMTHARLVEAIGFEVTALREQADRKYDGANNLSEQGDRLTADADLIMSLLDGSAKRSPEEPS